MINKLKLRKRRGEVLVEGIGGGPSAYTKGIATINLQSTVNERVEIILDAYILRTITSPIPATSIDTSSLKHISGLRLADPTFGTPGRIDLLLGADTWSAIIQEGVVTGNATEPCALQTSLGWIVLGQTATNVQTTTAQVYTANKCDEQRLDILLQKFWEDEEVPTQTHNTIEDECESVFTNTFTRGPDGRYCVQIPFRHDAPVLGNSRGTALRQFLQLERKLASSEELRDKYIAFMREYEALGHMRVIAETDIDPTQCYFIPHHAVLTKFRVVFNASAKSSNGVSLNDTLYAGPQLHDNLVDILHRFRRFAVAITADIRKMFRQIEVDPRHRVWQQILWRESPDHPIRTYQLNTVTYGMACSPYNAVRALHQCAVDNFETVTDAERAAAAHNSILHNLYVDDYLDSADDAQAALSRARDVFEILQKGKLELCKWNSNSSEVLAAFNGIVEPAAQLELGECHMKVLGLQWDPIGDELFYKVKVGQDEVSPTKRSVLSEVARLYDPIGMLAPVVVSAKILIQELWKANLCWDTPLPTDLRERWLAFRNGLATLGRIRIPRWVGMSHTSAVTLHGFCDASAKAYAAVIYVRSETSGGGVRVALVAAKTKVAPLTQTTIPRLELRAAHLLVTILQTIRRVLQLEGAEYVLWSDATIVLHWIRKDAASLKPFVSNRVVYIQEHSEINCWRHIRSESNPADCASRGVIPSALEGHSLWWSGPSCIRETLNPSTTLPGLTAAEEQVIVDEGRGTRTRTLLSVKSKTTFITTRHNGHSIPLVDKCSRLNRLLNITARIRRIQPTFKGHRGDVLTANELSWALLVHIKQAQGNIFITEINSLDSRSSVPPSSKLISLNPFLDANGILRVGGRLDRAELTYDQRHPMIIPKESRLTTLLVSDAHATCMHGNIQQMLQYLRRQFWIIHARSVLKTYVHRCVVCRRHQRLNQQQQMASLPASRVLIAPPFSRTGIDYCGPFHVRHGGRRSNSTTKTYAAIFVCMTTKAVHIELAEDLSTRAFIDIFDRFISRRGICSVIYSDNGTQFVGADRLMKQDLENWLGTYSQQHIAKLGTRWEFIPPSAPHHGGLWEAAVRSAKKHLYRVLGKQTLRFNELSTLLVRIEACLNSRPLVALHDDPHGGLAITPGDFLVGRPINSRPEPVLRDLPDNRLQYWERIQRMYEHFWTRWQNEYLISLQARSKWRRPEPNLQCDDVVLILNENLPPAHWRIGRVTAVHPGRDGLVRVVTVEYNSGQKTAEGHLIKHTCQRPVQKICRLTGPNEDLLNCESSAGQDV